MIVVFVLFCIAVGVSLCGVLVWLCDGQPLQPTAQETLIRRADEQHTAIMRGDDHLGTYGKYPPADL